MSNRILITGNGGSGKTWLATRLAARLQVPAVHLDDIYWAGIYGVEGRDKAQVSADVQKLSEDETWVIEGIYGWLLPAATPRANEFVFLDLPVEQCLDNLRRRGEQGGTEDTLSKMLAWVAEYPNRTDWYSRSSHQKLWEGFHGRKICLRSREAVEDYLTTRPERRNADLP